MPIILKNNASSTLATAISASDVGIVVADGSKFPSLGASDYFYATLVSSGGTTEIIKVTARAGNSMTVVRAQDGSSAASFASGALLEMRVNAASVTDLVDEHDQAVEISIADAGNYYTSTNVEGALQEVGADFAAIAASSGSSLVGYNQGGTSAVNRTVQSRLRDFVSVKDFGAVGNGIADDTAAIQAAIASTNSSGSWLFWNKGTYRLTSSLSLIVPQLRWKAEEAVLLMDLSGDVIRGVNISLADGVDHQLVGSGFEVNANGKCHSALRFIQALGTQTTNLYLEKVGARNVEMQVGVGEGSHGLSIRGGFKQVKLVDCYADNIKMRTGAGVSGSRGVTGIILQSNVGTTGAYIGNMILVRPTVRRVYSQDTSYRFDMDGIGLFANPSDFTYGPAYAEVTSSDISGCWGRDIKTQVSACKIDSPKSLRNEGPTSGINMPAYDFQTGSGIIIGGEFSVDGIAVTDSIVAFQSTTDGHPISSRWDGGSVDIYNGGSLAYVVFQGVISGTTKYVGTVSNINVNGAIQNFAWLRTTGFDIHVLKLDGIVCSSISEALVRVYAGLGSSPYRGIVYTKNCINLGAEIPTVKCNISGISSDVLLDDLGGINFGPADVIFSSTDQFVSGLSVSNTAAMPIPLSGAVNSGTQKLYSFTLDAGAEVTLPSHGFNSNYMAHLVMGVDRNSYAQITVDNNAISNISIGSGANVGTTSDPGTGNLRIWRSAGTNQLVVKNGSAALRVCIVSFLG